MCRIVVVDPQPAHVRAVSLTLSVLRRDCETATAEDGQSGLAVARERPFGIVLAAAPLPDMTFEEFAIRLRTRTAGALLGELSFARAPSSLADFHIRKQQLFEDLSALMERLHPQENGTGTADGGY